METLSFAFGVLATVAIVLIAATVVGTVKVFKMKNRLDNLERWIGDVNNELHRRIEYDRNHIAEVIADDRKELNLRIDSIVSYTDSRFDKMENKFNGSIAKNKVLETT